MPADPSEVCRDNAYASGNSTTHVEISDNIIVRYRGAVAEAGDVDLVVGQPRHPYTQLLINSVPEPDPNHPWGAVEIRTDVGEVANGATQVEIRRTCGRSCVCWVWSPTRRSKSIF